MEKRKNMSEVKKIDNDKPKMVKQMRIVGMIITPQRERERERANSNSDC
jgi:hypothetical protein